MFEEVSRQDGATPAYMAAQNGRVDALRALAGAGVWPLFGLAGLWIAVTGALALAGASWLVVRSERV
jgi:hypothetical protein